MFGSALTTAINVQIRADARQATRTMGRLSRSWRSFGQASSRLRAGLMGLSTMLSSTGVGLVAVGLAFRSSVRSMQAYSEQGARLRSIIRSSGQNLSTYPGLVASADQASRQWGFSMDEASAAMGTIIETGTNAADAMQVMAVSAEFARASETDLASSAQFLVDAYNQFSNGQNNPISQLRTLAATINVGSRITATSVEQMRQSFRYAAVEMSGMGYSAAETTAALGALASVGLKDMTAGTRLRQTLVKLGSPSRAAIELARSYHISVDRMNHITHDASGNIILLTQAFDNWRSIMHDLPSDQARLRLSHQVVGSRALAGALLFGSVKGERFNRTLHQISDSEQILTNHGAAAQTRMQGFASQLLLTKGAAQELGISFAEILFGSEQGMDFGRQFRDFATAVRLSDESARSSDEARAAWNGLSSEMQLKGAEWRETFIGLAYLVEMIGKFGLAMMQFVGAHPKMTAYLVGTYTLIRMLIPVMSVLFNIVEIGSAAFPAIAVAAEGAFAAITASTLGTVLSLGTLFTLIAEGGARGFSWIGGVSGDFDELNNHADAAIQQMNLGWTQYIPLIRTAVRWTEWMVELWRGLETVRGTLLAQRTTIWNANRAPIDERIAARMPAEQQRGLHGNAARRAAASQIYNETMMSLNALIRNNNPDNSQFGGSREAFQTQLMQAGVIDQAEINTMQSDFDRASRAVSDSREVINQTARSLRASGAGAEELTHSLIELRNYINSLDAGEQGNVHPISTPTAGDAYMTSSGFLPFQVSQGDLLVNRNSLANAMVSGPGGLAPPTPSSSAGNNTSRSSSGAMRADLRFEIPVSIDGREIARVVADRVLNMDQRRGATIEPGRREQVTQHGA